MTCSVLVTRASVASATSTAAGNLPQQQSMPPGQLLINGRWRDLQGGATMSTTDPMKRRARLLLLPIFIASVVGLTACTAPGTSINPTPLSGATVISNTPTSAPRAATLQVAGQTVAYLKQGSGPAVVIVHGIGGRKEDWQATMATLAGKRTVYAVDMIGFGGSSKTGADITIRSQVEAVRALLDAEGVAKASLIGNSVGGWVTATFASVYPARTDKLVLVDAAGFKAMFEGPSPVNFYPDTVADMRKLLSYVLVSPATQTQEFAERALAGLNASGDKLAAEAVFKGMFASPRLEEVMPGISAPTLVLWGAQDKLFPPAIADLVTGNIRGAKKLLIDNAGHFPQLDNPAAFHKAVTDFLL
jgi:pimeloyl-ACP methyl ester carboxylesterase